MNNCGEKGKKENGEFLFALFLSPFPHFALSPLFSGGIL
jgi:hypothetical protein